MSAEHMEARVAVLETQVNRLVSDIDSEKGTRARVNGEIMDQLRTMDDRQRKTERILYMGLGGIAVIEVAVGFMRH